MISFLVTAAIERSFKVIKETLDGFEKMTGLKPNLDKCNIFFAGTDDEKANTLCQIVNMPRGFLPVKYLGLPLVSSKLSYKDCQPIFEKIQKKIQSWTNKKLSYDGRGGFSH